MSQSAHLRSASHGLHLECTRITLHWLRAQERVLFKMAMLMYKASRRATPLYLRQLVRVGVADLPGRRCLRSARTNLLLVSSMKLSTVGGRAFPLCRTDHFEQSAGQRKLCSVSFDLPSASENISLPGLVSRHYHRSPLNHYLTFSGS